MFIDDITARDLLRISEQTGFDAGEEFGSEEEVRDYFFRRNLLDLFGHDADIADQEVLDFWADIVIAYRVHCSF